MDFLGHTVLYPAEVADNVGPKWALEEPRPSAGIVTSEPEAIVNEASKTVCLPVGTIIVLGEDSTSTRQSLEGGDVRVVTIEKLASSGLQSKLSDAASDCPSVGCHAVYGADRALSSPDRRGVLPPLSEDLYEGTQLQQEKRRQLSNAGHVISKF